MSDTTVVRVTSEHIAKGVRSSCRLCPIALAVLEALTAEGLANVLVSVGDLRTSISFDDVSGVRYQVAVMPEEATKFVHAFDQRKPVRPFEFELTWQEAAS